MISKNTLQNYFNSGSPDKRAKRKICGIAIAVTAVALVAAILVLAVSGIASAISSKKAAAAEGEAPSNAIETVSGSISDINANLNSKITLWDGTGVVIAETDVKTFAPANRTNVGTDAANPVHAYGCSAINYNKDALIIEAYNAFDKMACDFYNDNGQTTKICVVKVYNIEGQAASAYANALTVKLHTFDGNYENSIYGDARYDWIYENAASYGFVRVSNEEGEEDVFRYVGTVHAKGVGRDRILSDYISELKGATAEAPKKIKAKTSLDDGAKSTDVLVYYVPFGDSYALPNPDKYTFSASNVGDGYVISCFSK